MNINTSEVLFNRACDKYWIPTEWKTVVDENGKTYTFLASGLIVDHMAYISTREYILSIDMRDGSRIVFDGYHDCFVESGDQIHISKQAEAPIFSANLRYLMRRQGLTEESLGGYLNNAPSTIRSYANGTRLPTYEKLLAMCDVLDCSITDLTLPH